MRDIATEKEIKRAVRAGYAEIARHASCCSSSCCGSGSAADISRKLGYTEEEILSAPPESNMGLGCGNPLAMASLKKGEHVLDMGSGAGFDCFLAAKAVGPEGMVIGVDMTTEMVEKARAHAKKYGYKNVDFRQGELENMPVADNSVDVVISNCVINLVPDKERAFKEAFRVLKPGGRLIVSDIVLRRELPEHIRRSRDAYVGCLAGAVLKEDYIKAIRSAGFKDIAVMDETPFPVDCVPPSISQTDGEHLASEEDIGESASPAYSIKISARRPDL